MERVDGGEPVLVCVVCLAAPEKWIQTREEVGDAGGWCLEICIPKGAFGCGYLRLRTTMVWAIGVFF